MVTLIDDRAQRISEWVPLTQDEEGAYLFAEWGPGTDGHACAYVAYDPVSDRIAAGILDIPVTVRPENVPVELEIHGFADVPSVPLRELAREARALPR